ncbi:MAG: FeoA domain-containing protein [Verrucomicrobiota bacterium]|jgi:Fe2+ transport system protein FeoA
MKLFAQTTQWDDPNPPDDSGDCPKPSTCPLSRVRAGMLVRIKQLAAPPEVSRRLREIGFGEQQVIRLLVSQSSLICQVCNARLALSCQLAQLILVEPLPA